MSYIILVRHGRSEWNDKGWWTGWKNPPLTDEGREEAKRTANALKDIHIDAAFTSKLIRAQETLQIILKELKIKVPVKEDKALNERNYGVYTGKDKWKVKEEVGEEMFKKIRRSWDFPIPKGESLKMVYQRAIPYYEKEIIPLIKENKNVLVAASGNSLRAIVKYLESIKDDKIADVEIHTAEAWVYKLDSKGKMISKEVRAKNEKVV